MKIHVDNIPEEGMILTQKLDPRKISLTFGEHGIDFIRSIDVEVAAKKRGMEVLVDVCLETLVYYTCARCLAKFQDVFKKRFHVSYEAAPGGILDVGEDIRQEIILGYTMKTVCKSDCKGLCPNCGQNFNVAKCECIKDNKKQKFKVI